MNEQQAQLNRVEDAIGIIVKKFIDGRLSVGLPQFFVDELRQFVAANVKSQKVAPASPDRVMRSLRQKGLINYRVVSRSASLYEALPA